MQAALASTAEATARPAAKRSSQATHRYRAAIPAAQVGAEVLDSVVSTLDRGRVAVAVADLLGLGALDEAQLGLLRSYAQTLLGR